MTYRARSTTAPTPSVFKSPLLSCVCGNSCPEIELSCSSLKGLPALALFLIIAVLFTGQVQAFDQLTPAQALIYDRSHLSNTDKGQSLHYRYTSVDDDTQAISDRATLSVLEVKDDIRRDVAIEFLSEERYLPLPEFKDYRGNPVIIAMLEHIAQSLSSETSGGALYFRNRIRDALADDAVKLTEAVDVYAGEEVSTTQLEFSPFTNDQYLGNYPIFRTARFSIVFSDEVPGGVLSIDVSAKNDERQYERQLALQ